MMLWLLIVLCCVVNIQAQYEVPDAIVQALHPRGFKVSIPDEEGIKLFAFHGKINEEMNGREAGTFSRDILKPKDGFWTFYDPYTKLKVGDVIYYWTYVDYFDGRNKLGYPKDDQKFEVKELIGDSSTSSTSTSTSTAATITEAITPPKEPEDGTCPHTETTFNNGRSSCKGKLIFSEAFFTKLRNKFWTVDQKFASSPDYEFVIYVNRPEVINVNNSALTIKPVPIEDIYGTGIVNSAFDIGDNCTGVHGSLDCIVRPDAGFILPPVLSSKIHTKGKFSFKYGRIDIKAKLPQGDWIYPELYLNSVNDDYGLDYDSGQIRIAFTPGNVKLSHILQGGIILGSSPAARSYGMKNIEKRSSWTTDYHKYTVIWKPDSIIVSVDEKVYGSIYPPEDGFASLSANLKLRAADRWKAGTKFAPFDKEMYITVGVGVGGFNFEDKPDGTKPWKNGARSSSKDFYKDQSQWNSTWNEHSSLDIDYIKIWAL